MILVHQEVLEPDPGFINVRGRNDFTLLVCAAWGCHNHVIEYLLQRGADPNLRNYQGETGE